MGTETIIEILDKGKDNLKNVNRIVLSSNNKYYDLRKYMMNNNYYINKEVIVFSDNKYYIIIDFLKGNRKCNDKELYFGPYLLNNKDKLFKEYYGIIKDKLTKVIDTIPDNNDNKDKISKEISLLDSEL